METPMKGFWIFSVVYCLILITACHDDTTAEDKIAVDDHHTKSSSDQHISHPTESGTESDGQQKKISSDGTTGQISSWQMYMKVYEQNRAVQLEAVKTMQNYGKYEHRYKLADIVIKQLMKVLQEARVNITEWGYVPGDEFPTDKTVREGVSKVLENTAMFGDLALRLPDIVHGMYDKNREWQELIGWAVWFCQQCPVFEMSKASGLLLNLMSQELNLKEKDPLYINPFTDEYTQIEENAIERRLESKKQIKKEKKKKREKKRGPRMSAGARVEL